MDEVASGGTERVGERLRAAREAHGLSLAEVAERSRIPLRHLETIERGDFADLPALPYSTGFVKVYGNLVGLDGNTLSRDFRTEAGEIEREGTREEPYEPADPKRVPSRWIAFAGVAIAILLVLGYLIWRGSPGREQIARTAAGIDGTTVTPAPGTPAPQPAAPAAVAGGPVALVADSDVWMRVYERGGERLFTGVLKAGDRFEVPATATDPLIQTGRPEGLRITVGSQVAPPLGRPSTLVKDASLKPAALMAGPAAAPAPATAPSATPPPRRINGATPGAIASEPVAPPPAAPVGRPSGQSPPTQPPA